MCPDKDKNKHSDLNRNAPASPKEISLTLALDLAYLNALIAATFDVTYHVAGFAEYVVAEVVGDINCPERSSSADANCPSLVLHYTDIVAHADARVAGAFAGIAAELAKKVRDLEAFFNNWKNFKKA